MIFQNKEVRFFLHTDSNPVDPQELIFDNVDSIKNSFFDWRSPTKFIVTGWLVQPEFTTITIDSYLKIGSYNIILVDWSPSAVRLLMNSMADIPRTGQQIAEFIDFMAKWDFLKPDNLTIIGHSLGAHVAGHTGRYLKSGQLQVIIALDPYKPMKQYENFSLRASDAFYVESIQTSAGIVGYEEPMGKTTFYPNGGRKQEGCASDFLGLCSHAMAFRFFAEAIEDNGFPSIRCDNYKDALEKRCGQDYSPTVRMGAESNIGQAEGVFYVSIQEYSENALDSLELD